MLSIWDAANSVQRGSVPHLLFLLLYDESGQTILAAFYEKDAERRGKMALGESSLPSVF